MILVDLDSVLGFAKGLTKPVLIVTALEMITIQITVVISNTPMTKIVAVLSLYYTLFSTLYWSFTVPQLQHSYVYFCYSCFLNMHQYTNIVLVCIY